MSRVDRMLKITKSILQHIIDVRLIQIVLKATITTLVVAEILQLVAHFVEGYFKLVHEIFIYVIFFLSCAKDIFKYLKTNFRKNQQRTDYLENKSAINIKNKKYMKKAIEDK